jgi:hypothetical protein
MAWTSVAVFLSCAASALANKSSNVDPHTLVFNMISLLSIPLGRTLAPQCRQGGKNTKHCGRPTCLS